MCVKYFETMGIIFKVYVFDIKLNVQYCNKWGKKSVKHKQKKKADD